MDITNAQYIADDDGNNISVKSTIDGEEMFVPLDPENRHYAAVLEWAKEDGNTIEEAD
jgi:3-dehydroquinate synthase class II